MNKFLILFLIVLLLGSLNINKTMHKEINHIIDSNFTIMKEESNLVKVKITDIEYISEREVVKSETNRGLRFIPNGSIIQTIPTYNTDNRYDIIPEEYLVHFELNNNVYSVNDKDLFKKIKQNEINIGDIISLNEVKGWNKKGALIVHYFN
ncbi:hypothetical protein NE686_18190 [Tissierella carlieri]|uniref:G5 domain-containing protein n=1 Tax=Tissierella carlieri TaxID=689904 RepID=A0ABT1SGI8_9FIRM|nr:hypothetical protein [Tissierella carlieri]MCQ4925037.1 hypothetical protein [Tissierella carlieri]